MRLENTFAVPVPAEEAWKVLLDVERVAPCMPGATLTGFDGEKFTGKVRVKLGPVNLTYTGSGRFVSQDEAERTVVIEASGRDTTAAGTASATVTASLHPEGEGTRVDVETDLRVTGRPAQFGRGMLADVSGRLLGQFADCLAKQLTQEEAGPSPPADEPATAAGAGTEAVRVKPKAVPVTSTEPVPEAEPIDLLNVIGAGTVLRRLAPYAVGVGAALAAVWLALRRRRR